MLTTPTQQECFFRFEMRIISLNIMVFIARGDYKGIK